jgi:hypothetical protein
MGAPEGVKNNLMIDLKQLNPSTTNTFVLTGGAIGGGTDGRIYRF